jgi:hypothetical protein
MRSQDEIYAMWNRFAGLQQQLETGTMDHRNAATIEGINDALFWSVHPDSPDDILMRHFSSEDMQQTGQAGTPNETTLAETDTDTPSDEQPNIDDESAFPSGTVQEDDQDSDVPSQSTDTPKRV